MVFLVSLRIDAQDDEDGTLTKTGTKSYLMKKGEDPKGDIFRRVPYP